MLKQVSKLAVAAMVFAAIGMSGYGQSAVDGAIAGTVEDAGGAVISGATIVIHSNKTDLDVGWVGLLPSYSPAARDLYGDNHGCRL